MKRLSLAICIFTVVLGGFTTTKGSTERFSSGEPPFDLSNKSILFTPNADRTSYTACLQQITQLPTDPAGGTELELDDDGYDFAYLSGGKTVSIFGNTFGVFFVGSNGYITFTEGDSEYAESLGAHFAKLRISILYRDLNPTAAGVVSWKQFANRAVVTWQGVPEYGSANPNTFQVEMYFDGRIRLAWLAVAAQRGVVGLSNGLGVPQGFQETDLSAYPACEDGPSVSPIISGWVQTAGGSAIGDVLLTFSNDGGSTKTNITGYYSNPVWYGWSGVVTVSKSGYVFDPRSRSYSNVTADTPVQNYTGTLAARPDYYTQEFSYDTAPLDLSGRSIMFTPTAGGTSYNVCVQKVSQLPTNPAAGIDLHLDDDDYEFVSLSNQKTVRIFSSSFPGFYVGSNGYITFTEGDTDYRESLADHFRIKRISVLFHDFCPDVAGTVSWRQLGDRVAVTWQEVVEFLTEYLSTFQVEMFFDGRIRLTWLDVAAWRGIVGLSDGLSLPADFKDTDLSMYPPCEGGPPISPTISGSVRTSDTSPISSVTLTFSGGVGTTTTDSSGNYSKTVEYGWSGVVTPNKSGYTFDPPSIQYSNVTSAISGQNYVGTIAVGGDHFTEQFSTGTNPFDLSNKSIMFTPFGNGASYTACLEQIAQLPTNPVGGTQLTLEDDDSLLVSLDDQKTVSIYGSSFTSFYIGSNGYITFNEPDTEYRDLLTVHFSKKRISGLFCDLNPPEGQSVSWKQLADRAVVTWRNIPEYAATTYSTFQVEMYFDGRIRLAWLEVAVQGGIVGLSEGIGVPEGFQETDLSAYELCGGGGGAVSAIAYWKMDDNAANTTVLDSSGASNHGTARRNTSTLTTAGRINGALTFNGTGDYVAVPDRDEWTFSGDFTISMWVKFNSFSSNWWESAFAAHDEGPGETNKWIFSYNPAERKTVFHINGPGAGYPLGGYVLKGNTWTAQTGVWYFLCISRSGNTYTFYRQGQPDGTAANTAQIPNAATPLTIGWAEGARTFAGALDDVRIYNRALSNAEITELYNQQP